MTKKKVLVDAQKLLEKNAETIKNGNLLEGLQTINDVFLKLLRSNA